MAAPAAPAPVLEARVSYRPPFDAGALLGFLSARAVPGVEVVSDGRYRRTVAGAGGPGVVEVEPLGGSHELAVRFAGAGGAEATARAAALFDAAADPAAVAATLGRCPHLGPLAAARPGLRVPGAWDPFELCVRAVLGQQVSVAAARTLAGRIAARFGASVPDGGPGLERLFPGAEALAEADLESVGLTRARAASVRGLAAARVRGDLPLEPGEELEEAVRRLCRHRGIGRWTAQYVALRALRHPDAFPEGDLGLRRALGGAAGPVLPDALLRAAEAWRPWRGYAALHLWTSEGAPAKPR